MRSLPAILLAALTAVVIAASAVLTASHFGMRDWPTPPMPDTATRLITPTEAAGRASDRAVSEGADAGREIAADGGAPAAAPPRAERHVRSGATGRSERSRRRASRRGASSGGASAQRRSGTRTDTATGTGDDAAPEAPETPATENAPAEPAGAGTTDGEAQARPDETDMPAVEPPVTLAPIVPDLPPVEEATDATADEPAEDAPKHGRKGGRGRDRDLLDQGP